MKSIFILLRTRRSKSIASVFFTVILKLVCLWPSVFTICLHARVSIQYFGERREEGRAKQMFVLLD